MAAPTRLNWSRTDATTTDNAVIDLTSIPDGSWMILALIVGSTVDAAPHPAGWTNPLPTLQQVTGSRRLALAYRTKVSGDTSVSWGTAASAGKSAFLMWGSGAAPTAEWVTGLIGVRNAANVVSGQSVQAGDSFTSVAPSVSVADADSLVLSFMFEATSATGAFTLTSGATLWFSSPESASFIEAAVVGYTTPAAGATSPVVSTAVATQASNGAGVQIILPPGDTPTPPDPEPGFSSVNQMLATPGATWAHRGGSANWPEMSEYAYDQSALAGYGALEFSAQRSSDGWWFGLHDNNFDRTSETTGTPAPSTLTQADILSTYQNTLNDAGTPRPYWGLIDFLDKWTPTHVVIVDPKNQLTFSTEFLDLLDAHGGPTKIIVKYSGPGASATALADAAEARGYQTWGYFYDTDVTDGDLALWQEHWSLLGMNINAASSAWDAVKSYGKLVVGHIAQDQAMYDLAITNGSRMVQVANVAGVAAVGPSSEPSDITHMSTGDVEIAYLRQVSGITGLASLSDLRNAVYGDDQYSYFAGLSGLSEGSLADHKYAYYAAQSGAEGSLVDVARAFWAKELGNA